MAVVFGAAGDYRATRTLTGSSTDTNTLMFQVIVSNTTNQGIYGGLVWDPSGTPRAMNFGNNGSAIWCCNQDNTYGNFGYLPSTTVWYTLVIRRVPGTNDGNFYGKAWNGSAWSSTVDLVSGNGGLVVSELFFGRGNGITWRSTSVDGASTAYMRYWDGTHLTDGELETEINSATPVKSGCTAHFVCNNSYDDALGGSALSPTATHPTLDTNLPATGGGPITDGPKLQLVRSGLRLN